MGYYFADYKASPQEGRELRIPDSLEYSQLACPGCYASWAICHVGLHVDEPLAPGFHGVPDELYVLLSSAEGYPPAIALSRDEVEKEWDGRRPTRQQFAASLAESLRRHLRAQPHVNYRLAEGAVEDLGYLSKGEFCWVLEYKPASKSVRWVSNDYFVYENAASDFNLTQQQLDMLSK